MCGMGEYEVATTIQLMAPSIGPIRPILPLSACFISVAAPSLPFETFKTIGGECARIKKIHKFWNGGGGPELNLKLLI